MGRTPPAPREPVSFRRLRPLLPLAGDFGLVAALYWARALLIPIALAVLLTFLLTPWLRGSSGASARRRGAAWSLVVVGFTGGAVWLLTLQAASLTDEIPRYRDNLKQKIADVRGASRAAPRSVQPAAQEVTEELKKDEPRRGLAGRCLWSSGLSPLGSGSASLS
jgi:predicted PurR-regulated permease PerM